MLKQPVSIALLPSRSASATLDMGIARCSRGRAIARTHRRGSHRTQRQRISQHLADTLQTLGRGAMRYRSPPPPVPDASTPSYDAVGHGCSKRRRSSARRRCASARIGSRGRYASVDASARAGVRARWAVADRSVPHSSCCSTAIHSSCSSIASRWYVKRRAGTCRRLLVDVAAARSQAKTWRRVAHARPQLRAQAFGATNPTDGPQPRQTVWDNGECRRDVLSSASRDKNTPSRKYHSKPRLSSRIWRRWHAGRGIATTSTTFRRDHVNAELLSAGLRMTKRP